MNGVKLLLGDCLEVMGEIEDGSVDLILTDLPYQVTECKWDVMIPFEPLWAHYRRVLKPRGAVVLTASQPFTSMLVMSNPKWFRYCWVWDKAQSGNKALARVQPLKITEDICVFYGRKGTYNPQMRTGKPRWKGGSKNANPIAKRLKPNYSTFSDTYYPVNIISIPNCINKSERCHPAQKPVALMEYLIRTYSSEGETVLDSCVGSGTTLIACLNTNRHGIGIEKDPTIYALADRRIAEARSAMPLLASQS